MLQRETWARRAAVTCSVVRLLSLLVAIASDIAGAIRLLDLSVFAVLAACPLLQLDSPPGFAVHPSKLAPAQRDAFRRVLRPMLQLVLTLVRTVRSFRGTRDEVLRFVRATVNASLLLLEDRQADETLALEVLALYQAVLALLACEKRLLEEDLHGFERVVAEKMRENLRRLEEEEEKGGLLGRRGREREEKEEKKEKEKEEKEEEGEQRKEQREQGELGEPREQREQREQSEQKERREQLLRRVAESSVVFLHAFGEEIPEKVVKILEEN